MRPPTEWPEQPARTPPVVWTARPDDLCTPSCGAARIAGRTGRSCQHAVSVRRQLRGTQLCVPLHAAAAPTRLPLHCPSLTPSARTSPASFAHPYTPTLPPPCQTALERPAALPKQATPRRVSVFSHSRPPEKTRSPTPSFPLLPHHPHPPPPQPPSPPRSKKGRPPGANSGRPQRRTDGRTDRHTGNCRTAYRTSTVVGRTGGAAMVPPWPPGTFTKLQRKWLGYSGSRLRKN
eukprot:COSAG02_NODE_1276_length_13504_cov_15.182618_3_plen_234_part_00